MPQVPTYDDFQVSAQDAPNARFDRLSSDITPGTAAIGTDEVTKLGQSMQSAGSDVSSIVDDYQKMANQARINDAMNQAREAAMQLTYDPQNGYTQQKGLQALQRDSGQSLADEYTGKLQDQISQISAGLGNDAQRFQFAQQAKGLTTQFYGSVTQHEGQEFHNYNVSVQDGTMAVSRDAIGKQWNNPDAVQQNVNAIYAAAYQKAQLMGFSATEAQALAQKEASNGHTVALSAALQAGNLDYAQQYIKKFGSSMDADDLMRATGLINKEQDNRDALNAATSAINSVTKNANAPDADRLANLVMGTESGGRETDGNGNVLTSSAGAKGSMQVLDSTNANPGFGVTPAKDNSPEERKRVGRDYLAALVAHYGDLGKGLAAYNAGPGNVDNAIQKAQAAGNPNNWMQYLPKPQETVPYVNKILTAYASGAGGNPQPTLQQVHDLVRQQLANSNPRALQLGLQQATTMFSDWQKAKQSQDDQNVQTAMRALEQNGGHFSQLPISIRANIPPDKVDNLLSYGQKIAKGEDVSNPALYLKLASNPDYMTGLSDAQFYALRGQLSQADFDKFAQERGKLMNGSNRDTAQDLDSRGLTSILNNRLQQLGIPTQPKDGSPEAMRLGAIQKYVRDSILNQQQSLGKKMQYNDMSQYIDQMFTRSLNFHTDYLGGMFTSHSSQRMLTMQAGDIPSDTRNSLRQDFVRQGNPNPTDAELLGAYWKLQSQKHGWH